MVSWNYLQDATLPDSKPTPGWLLHEICKDVRNHPLDCPDVAEYLMQCVCSNELNIQLKAVLVIRHLALKVLSFQLYMQSCQGVMRILHDIAAPPIVPQARTIEPQDVRTLREATQRALDAICRPGNVEVQADSAHLRRRILGFGNCGPSEEPKQKAGASGQLSEFVADSIGDMVDDFRDKGAIGALKDASVDAVDMVLDGVDAMWGWLVGKKPDADRICNPSGPTSGLGFRVYSADSEDIVRRQPFSELPQSGFRRAPASRSGTASDHYYAAFGGVVGANIPYHLDSPFCSEDASNDVLSKTAPCLSPSAVVSMDLKPEPQVSLSVDLLDFSESCVQPEPKIQDLLGD